ncbi:Transglycosylase SLT domain-containing protein [Methylobacterium sp. 174MFSha1.1]|uniref:lytic transglycosylase domain-containing protein n=1 Tax=Methylobacterium sp. 174MFSha1.1 TaxID=1502749 RepID=UPI0008E1B24D|nr:lytic transglycosylase domain-containing protein [Methylobacterium sp. 174MFSha1.1]SFV03641.1 Transglycosylase SLT domain-containing protein [Methylobacterium sp. 174MFSha1.1]
MTGLASIARPVERPLAARLAAALILAGGPAWAAGDRDPAAARGGPFAGIEAADGLVIVARPSNPFPEPAWAPLFPGRDDIRALIVVAAHANDLPPDFFLRLLRQESGLDPRAVSRAGAQGIAQFMPYTAAERGLRDPFDPSEAIPKSAALLREHQARFGNLGLAAAAYNAGPQRVRNWLDGRSALPMETQNYVRQITGRAVEDWAPPGAALLSTASRPMGGTAWAAALGATATLGTTAALGSAGAWGTTGRALWGPAWHATAGPARPARWASTAPRDRQALRGRAAATTQGLGHPARTARSVPEPRSEKGLCATLNAAGAACIVQAVY